MKDINEREEAIKKLLDTISDEAKRIINRVIDIENENLHMKQPHILDDIERIVREEVK